MLALSRSARTLAEIRALLALATPIIIAQLAHTAMGFVDTLMAGRVSPQDLAAVALGNSIWVPVYLLVGEHELTARVEPAKEWFDLLEAPEKRWYSLPDAGHSVAFEQADELHRILLEDVRPA